MLLVIPKGWVDLMLADSTPSIEAPGITDISQKVKVLEAYWAISHVVTLTTGMKPAHCLSDEEARPSDKLWITKTKSRLRYRGKDNKKAPLSKRGFLVLSNRKQSNSDASAR